MVDLDGGAREVPDPPAVALRPRNLVSPVGRLADLAAA